MVYTDPGKTVEENISGLQKTKSGIGKDMGNKISLFFFGHLGDSSDIYRLDRLSSYDKEDRYGDVINLDIRPG